MYLGECKVWGGKAALHDALDQVLGYGTWRDHGLGLVIFFRGTRFRQTLKRAVAGLEEHAAFLSWVEGPASTAGDDVVTLRWVRLRQRADPDAEVIVAVQFAYLPTARAERIGGGVDDIEGGIDVLLGLRETFLASNEPIAYRPSMGSATGALSPEPGSMMRYERVGPAGRVAIDAVPADEAAAQRYGPEGAIELHPDERGDRALRLIEEAHRWGVSIEVVGGFGITRLSGFYAAANGDSDWGCVSFGLVVVGGACAQNSSRISWRRSAASMSA